MAGDSYYGAGPDNPYTTDTQNNGDWWTQNAPAGAPSGAPQGAVPPPYDPNDPNAYVISESFGWPDPSTGQPMGGPSGAGGVGGYYAGPNSGAPWWHPDEGSTGGPAFGGPVAPFDPVASGMPGGYPTFTPPPLPDALKNPWTLPTAEELQATPGYMERFRMGLTALDRGAAARGTVLNGGTRKAENRFGQDYASGEYSNLVGQKLNERQQQSADYLNLAYGPAWQQNTAAVNQYGQLYKQYEDLIGNNRTSQNDYWQHQMDLLNAGLAAARAGSPGSTGGQG